MIAALALVALLGAAAPARDPAGDWDLTVRPDLGLTAASLTYGENILAVRCQRGALDVLVSGMPVSTGSSRTVRVSAGAIADEEQRWIARPGEPVLGPEEPARLARQLRAGGELDLRVEPEAEGGRPRRYRLPVPASAASIDTVLSACGMPLDEPRDLLRRASGADSPIWRAQPQPEFPPSRGAMQAGSGTVQVSCVIGPAWELADCRAETETPPGVGFAQAAIRAAERAEISPPRSGADVRGQVIRFTARFRLGS